MHSLAVVLIPFKDDTAHVRSCAARQAAARARVEMLMFRYQEPDDLSWGVSVHRGFTCDWWEMGGRWHGWGRQVRRQLRAQGIPASTPPIPRSIEPNAVWCEDLARVRPLAVWLPSALITPYGDWLEPETFRLTKSGVVDVPAPRAKAAWRRKAVRMVERFPECLAVAVDYHW